MAKSKADRYGIGMKKFCRAHEEKLARALAEEGPPRELLALHLEKLRWLQHERLVHLIVVCLTAGAVLFCADLALLPPELNPAAAVLTAGMAILLGCYFVHYFFLENTTQHWYRLAGEAAAALAEAGNKEKERKQDHGSEDL